MTSHRLRDLADAPKLPLPGVGATPPPAAGDLPPLRAASANRGGDIAGKAAVLLGAGLALDADGRIEEAQGMLERAMRLEPDCAEIPFRLGYMLHRRGDLDSAVEHYRAAAELDPGRGDVLTNLGAALVDLGSVEQGVKYYRAALEVDPERTSTLNNLGLALLKLGHADEAAVMLERAAASAPDNAELLNNAANVLVEQGQVGAALDRYEQALHADPGHLGAMVNLAARAGAICDWDRQELALSRLRARLTDDDLPVEAGAALVPLSFTLPYASDDADLIRTVVHKVGAWYAKGAKPIARRAPIDRRADRPIRIGYLSPDFGDHPISHVTLPIYPLHDRARFHVTCYSTLDRSEAGGDYLSAIRSGADRFVDLSQADFVTTARRIADDEIDILVDLCGYMRHSRPQILAMRPAPIQVYWQGHTGSLGAPHIDYVLGDPIVMPAEDAPLYAEQIVRLPDTFSSADRPAISGRAVTRAAFGLPEFGIVFCAFNNPLKIERETFATWMRILNRVPDSVLWLSRPADPVTEANLTMAARRHHVDAHRLVFADRLPDKSEHLARHRLADLFLDTFKFNASTTALDALWAGLPIVARYGATPHSRLTTSYLSALGLLDLSVGDAEAFETLAVELALDPARLATLKETVAERCNTMPLFDAPRFVHHLEYTYRLMWQDYCAGEPPRSFDVPAQGG